MKLRTLFAGALAGAISLTSAAPAHAFCGFYVSGADAKLYNNATMVALMRDGTRTVLSMQNNYQGPAEDFAMVVPVPVVLQKENVKTLPFDVFNRLDQLAAPRLVEYWEKDPCSPEVKFEGMASPMSVRSSVDGAAPGGSGVTVEAQFKVGEYDIVVLSAKFSSGLDTWLRQNGYKIPPGAEPLLQPYVEEGMKFFVAKVDSKKVKTDDKGRIKLSPLRFHYDDAKFRLPVRLGMINAKDKQDLIVHILAKGKRYEVANFENVTIPTNINVTDDVRADFGAFYAALFDRTVAKNPKAVITEYAWDAGGCDPCPVPALNPNELVTLGADVISQKDGEAPPSRPGPMQWTPRSSFVLTRLHARYDKGTMGEDLVFKPAPSIVGGREFVTAGPGTLEKGSKSAPSNAFQARYAIRHKWAGEVKCDTPVFNRWGGPPNGNKPKPIAAQDLAFATRGQKDLAEMVTEPVTELGVVPGKPSKGKTEPLDPTNSGATPPAAPSPDANTRVSNDRGCACTAVGPGGTTSIGLFAALGGLGLAAARRRKSR